ncbi:RBPJ-interacting and tubulin-associated protein 1-like [Ruditapes philippinarum]|uniref:RBPJ-interacting and tubulin-associated protein 1-like n=1 Tax=Ruditapes philippinarum TaxID=129788 RepID=UPI00295AEB2E|nr:RBPJ-interacting and tubulin-associated protein 1-like [Ruditapes philippinarum]
MRMEDLELTGTRPPSVASSRPSSRTSNRPNSGYHVVSEKSNVDELLFTSHHPRLDNVKSFKPPWSNTPRCNTDIEKSKKMPRMKPLLWTPSDDRGTYTSQSDKKGYRSSNKGHNHTLDVERLNRYRPVKQKPSFCDESLFGPRLEEPSFEAPWADKTKKPKPYLFSPLDYARLTREGSTMSAKYSSSGTLDGRPPSRQGRRPKTASTRPVTVESAEDIHKPTWRP